MRQTFAFVNLSNIAQNYLNIKNSLRPNVRVMPVVKADAYGHGMVQVAGKLTSLNPKPEYFGVALYEEGAALRKSGITEKILVFEPLSEFSLQEIIENDLIPTITNKYHLELLNQIAGGRKIAVHIKLDSGMGRVGAYENEFIQIARGISENSKMFIDGIYTHFATSDEEDQSFAILQLEKFNFVIGELERAGINCGVKHAANSGAIINLPESSFDMVRPGISLYGYTPAFGMKNALALLPAMSLVSIVEDVRYFPANRTVSYGRLYKTKEETKIITVPIGYADGLYRGLTHKLKALIGGKTYPQVGRITMDRIMFDIGNDDIKRGEKVILIGESGKTSITCWDLAREIDTIPYEITCNISKRVPRIYV